MTQEKTSGVSKKVKGVIIAVVVLVAIIAAVFAFVTFGMVKPAEQKEYIPFVTENISENGAYLEVEETIENEKCNVTFHGISADADSVKFLFTMEVFDEKTIAFNKKLYVSVIPDSIDAGENVEFTNVEAYQDADNTSLYHFVAEGYFSNTDADALYSIKIARLIVPCSEAIDLSDVAFRGEISNKFDIYEFVKGL